MTRRLVRLANHLHSLSATLALAAIGGAPASAQVIPLRTVPVASGDQFLMLPSATMGMGGVRLAVDDTLADAWSNPAKGSLVSETAFLGSPTYYGISNNGGGGRTFPIAALVTGSTLFGGGALALQQIEDGGPEDFFCCDPWWGWSQPRRISDSFSRNLYASGFVGVRLGSAWAVGIGGSAASLDAMDGVDLLYAGSDRIEQSGSTQDIRVGVYHAAERDRLELTLLHSRVSMEHDVTWTDWVVDPITMSVTPQQRIERNEDRGRTWGAHLAWDRDLSAPGWRVGASGTVNRKSHPKIPNYQIQNIPRDPGLTWAYEAAVGFARSTGATTFGLDVALQPIWSETWQEADTADVNASGGDLQVGDRSIENDFFFTNVMLRSGLAHDVGRATLQAGLEVRSYAYTLEQVDHVQESNREQDETWMEWTPTFGVALRFSELQVRYAGRVTSGTGRPGTELPWGVGFAEALNQSASPDFIIAPSGPLTLQSVSVVTHQISVRVAVR
ncbi:MAG TPA: hypothetical protein VM198_07545 [Longimicrobiales bacterium]|nr:hypothetical protein [Longimicrobiales bacterium]